jgi:uncharacterized protein YydD (DUF2326 family)
MSTPLSEHHWLKRERAVLPEQILARLDELAAMPAVHTERREHLERQIRSLRKRLVTVDAQVAALRAEGP